ncbi:MAG: nickel-dependent lactate racemase [Nitrospinae bacterium]|nr:nickel-dependent lactate racemase [Nitrospinota bacterium]
MEIHLKYGKGVMRAVLPGGWHVEELQAPKKLPIPDPRDRLAAFLDSPVHGEPFNTVFEGKKNVAVIVPDITRKAGVAEILPVVLERLEECGIGSANITIIFATGIHPAQTAEQMKQVAGEAVFERYACIGHDCREAMGKIGGVQVNRHVASADGKIIIGGVKMHYLAGFGGGRKAILPGVTSYEECMAFHRLCLNPSGPGRHPGIGPGNLRGNPMHERATAWARSAGVDFLVNTVLDEAGDFIFINAGDLEASFEQACRFAAEYEAVPIAEKFDVVIASCGGFPADINFIQSHKSLDAACRAVQPGGAVLLVAECSAGVGNADFLKWFDHGNAAAMDAALRRNFVINGQTAFATREKTEMARVFLLSGLNPEDVLRMGMTHVASLEEGMARCLETAGPAARAAIIHDGGLVMPIPR